ncbi:MAG TPA: hypothetical protein VHX16_10975 [Chloroflexota bacterium]|nr:hypothetical protein [Chloroflexota bacterium]
MPNPPTQLTMNVVRNAKLIQKRVRIASAAHLLALLCFSGGLFISREEPNLWLVYATMLIGLALYSVGQHILRRWGPRYRYDGLIVQALKGLDKRYTFGAFVHPGLPDYVVIGPQGIVPLIARPQTGLISCRSDRWSRDAGRWGILSGIFTPGLKNPTADARRAAAQLQDFMTKRFGADVLEGVPVQPTIVFISPRARLRIDGSSVPVTSAKELRTHLRKGKPALSSQQAQAIGDLWQSLV